MIERYTRLQALLSDYADTNLADDLTSAIRAALEDSYERGYMHGFHDKAWRPETKYDRATDPDVASNAQ